MRRKKIWTICFDDAKPAPAPAPAPEPDTQPAAPEPAKTFTQDEVNAILKKEKAVHRQQLEKQISELQMLQKKANLTSEEKQQLDARVEEMQNQLLTKEQRAKSEIEKIKKELDDTTKKLATERDEWKNRYTNQTIETSLLNAAVEFDAFDPEQIISMLGNKTHLIEEIDDKGKVTGRLVPRVTFTDVNEAGQPLEVKIPVADAVKRMSEIPKYFNLFKAKGQGGFGGSNQRSAPGKNTPADIAKGDVAQYIKGRISGQIDL